MFKRGFVPFIVAAFLFMSGASLCRAQETTPPSAKSPERLAWHKSMVHTPLPQAGCFKAEFPSTEWREVRCGTAPPPLQLFRPVLQRPGPGKGGLNNVGNGGSNDWSALSSGSIVSAEGSFQSVTPGTTETGAGGSDSFSLQLNTRPFNSTTCNNIAGCQGWEQFVFANNSPSPFCTCIYVQYWMINWGSTACPSGWQQAGVDCVSNGNTTDVSGVATSKLSGLTLTGKATGGTDTVILDSGGDLSAAGQDSTLNLEGAWNVAEFNVFGDGNSSEAVFGAGTTIVVQTSVDDGTSNAPSCLQKSFTGETSNLNLANTTGSSTSLVCCPYGGTNPSIEFMETNAGHTGTCGPTSLIGDPHITTLDGTHYDFQGAGEFVSVRESDGQDIQTRQKPVSTTFIGTDGYDGLTTCVSLNTAVAARVGEHRVTYEPNLSGVPDPGGLQLRVDGALKLLGPSGMALAGGGRIVPIGGGALEVDFPDGKTLFVTPEWWQSQGEWFLDVDVTHHGLVSSGSGGSATGGIVGPIAEGRWLPALPNGASLGPMPATLPERYLALYKKFADAWRVTNRDSLFDYAPGTSTDTFTMKSWPLEKPPCIVPETKPVEPASLEVAEAACRRVLDPSRRADCVFDVRATGNLGFAIGYLATQRILADSTSTSLTADVDPSQAGEWVTFSATVVANSTTAFGAPSGTVQFAVDGANVGAPVIVDARGHATWATSALKVGTHRVTASYLPGTDSVFLPSTSLEKAQTVKRCFCEAERKYK
jgi:hypothetical protein